MKTPKKIDGKITLQKVGDNFPAIFFSLNVNNEFQQSCNFISENCVHTLGFSTESLVNDWEIFLNQIDSKDQLIFKEKFLQAKANKNRLDFKFLYTNNLGKTFWLKLNANLIDKIDFVELQGIITDITFEYLDELEEEQYSKALIYISRHPFVVQGDLNNIGEFSVRLLSQTLKASRTSLWLYDDKNNTILCDKRYVSKTDSFESGTLLTETEFPEYFNAILSKPYVIADNARANPDTKCFNEVSFIPNNIFSLLDVPILHNGKLLGILCIEQTEKIREWQKSEINFLFQFSEYISYCFAVSERNLFEEELEYLNENLADMVEAKTLELALKNKDILDSIRYAKTIQTAILPELSDMELMLNDFFVLYKPKDIVAGDFFWLHHTEKKIYIAVCDCTEHGVPGAFISIFVYQTLLRVVNEFKLTEPKDILTKVHSLFNEHFRKHGNETIDGMEIGLITIEYINQDQTLVQYAGAGIPLYFSKPNSSHLEKIECDKKPIGFNLPQLDYNQHEMVLHKSSMLYLFSDGCFNQFGGPSGKKLLRKHFEAEIKKNIKEKTRVQYEEISNFLSNWQGKLDQLDDMCLLGIRF